MAGSKRTAIRAAVYEIKVRGSLDESWTGWFSELAIFHDEADLDQRVMTLKGPLVDQSALRGILTRLWDMNLEILSLQQAPLVADEEENDAEHNHSDAIG